MANTYFGEEIVTPQEKSEKVNTVFSNVASYYRFMNNVMCFGTHHVWRNNAVMSLDCRASDHVLDLACGTGDCGELIIKNIPHGHLYSVDPCIQMLQECQQKIIASNTSFIQAPAEALPDLDNKIDKAIICFGIRNFTDPALALKSVYEKMRNGGKVVILEFNPPVSSQIPSTYSNYIRNVLPRLGKKLVGDEYSYQYLSDSIQKEPSPENRRECLRQAGFEMINYLPLSLGILGLFEAYKY